MEFAHQQRMYAFVGNLDWVCVDESKLLEGECDDVSHPCPCIQVSCSTSKGRPRPVGAADYLVQVYLVPT